MHLLSIDGLSVRFGGVEALSEVSLDLEAGGIFGIIGPNGAGKTTLINAISGLIRPTSGRILLEGDEIQSKPAYEIARLGLARAFQHAELMPEETAIENILTGQSSRAPVSLLDCMLRTSRLRASERAGRASAFALLDKLGLAEVAEARVSELPYGTLKKIDIARALIGRPRLLLLDEPTAGLSDAEADAIIGLCLATARETGAALLVIEHNLRVVMSISDRMIVLDHGRKIADGPPGVVTTDRAVVTAYLGEDSADA
jgi:branched-chain amino acid transport system ATP-binding protein